MATGEASSAPKVRIALYDNAKFLLMALVVTGHFLQQGFVDVSLGAQALRAFIYSFHMPLFIFLSGLFIRRERLTAKWALRRSSMFLLMCLATKAINAAARVEMGVDPKFSLIEYPDVSWFMLAFVYYVWLVYLLRKANAVLVGVVSVVLALVAGNYADIDATFCLSRTVVFFPFFWLGCVADRQSVTDVVTKRSVRIVSVVVLVAFAVLCAMRTEWANGYIPLLKGTTWYGGVGAIENCSWMHRLGVYVVGLIMSAAVLGATPQGHCPGVTVWGQRTMQVYLLHFPVLILLRYGTGIVDALVQEPWGWMMVLPLSVLITAVLSLCDVAGRTRLLVKRRRQPEGQAG